MRNVLDKPVVREALGSRDTETFVRGTASATYGTLLSNAESDRHLLNIIYNCEFSTVSATIIWLQERGVIIPADILASLNIEGGPVHA